MKISAGILLYRIRDEQPEFFLVHPGGPFFAKKNDGVWSIPKGELNTDEDPMNAAIREFEEETGQRVSGNFFSLQPVVQKSGKKVICWAVEGEINAETINSNTFEMEWPPKSGKMKNFPEIDRAGWFDLDEARRLINERQIPLLEELWERVKKG